MKPCKAGFRIHGRTSALPNQPKACLLFSLKRIDGSRNRWFIICRRHKQLEISCQRMKRQRMNNLLTRSNS